MTLNSTTAPIVLPVQTGNIQDEHPEQRIHRLAKEMSFLLDGFDDYSVVLIFPSKSREYPIHICLDRDFADLMQHAIKYREDA